MPPNPSSGRQTGGLSALKVPSASAVLPQRTHNSYIRVRKTTCVDQVCKHNPELLAVPLSQGPLPNAN